MLCKGHLTSMGVLGIYSYKEVHFGMNILPSEQKIVRNINKLNENKEFRLYI